MKIVAHDEDSLGNLLFCEVERHGKIVPLVNKIRWRNHSTCPFRIASAELHQQVNLSEFGQPDAVILVNDDKGAVHIIIIEAKLHSYVKACRENLSDFKFNWNNKSKLNNQLTLRYRFLRALPRLREKGYVSEIDHVDHSPYSTDRVRRCKKLLTLRIFEGIAEKTFDFYLAALTLDDLSPLREMGPSDEFFPLFFDQQKGTRDDFTGLGSLSWEDCHDAFGGTDNHFSYSYKALVGNSFELGSENSPEAEESFGRPLIKGRHMVEYGGKICLLSCRRCSYSIQHLQDGRFVELDRGKSDKKKFEALRGRIRLLGKAPSINMKSIEAWKHFLARSSDS